MSEESLATEKACSSIACVAESHRGGARARSRSCRRVLHNLSLSHEKDDLAPHLRSDPCILRDRPGASCGPQIGASAFLRPAVLGRWLLAVAPRTPRVSGSSRDNENEKGRGICRAPFFGCQGSRSWENGADSGEILASADAHFTGADVVAQKSQGPGRLPRVWTARPPDGIQQR